MCRGEKAAPPARCFRSLAELTRDYEARTQLTCFRSLDELTRDYECAQHAVKHLVGCEHREPEAPAAAPPQADACYHREKLLSVLAALRRADALDAAPATFNLRTLAIPPPPERRRCGGRKEEEDPALDDENLIGVMEDRLSRESGSDASNEETFGETGGWTFEEALEANAALAEREAAASATEDPTPSALRAEAACFEMPSGDAPSIEPAELGAWDEAVRWGLDSAWAMEGCPRDTFFEEGCPADAFEKCWLAGGWAPQQGFGWYQGLPRQADGGASTEGGSEDASSISEASFL